MKTAYVSSMKRFLYIAMAAGTAIMISCNSSREQRAGQQLSGLFLVHQDGKTGFVNKSGKLEITPQFANAAPFPMASQWSKWAIAPAISMSGAAS